MSVAAGVRIGASSRAMRVGLGAALLEIGDQLGLSLDPAAADRDALTAWSTTREGPRHAATLNQRSITRVMSTDESRTARSS